MEVEASTSDELICGPNADDIAIAPVVSVKSVYSGDLKYRTTASIVLCETVEVVD